METQVVEKEKVDFIAQDKKERELFNAFLAKKRKTDADYESIRGLRFIDKNDHMYFFFKKSDIDKGKVLLSYSWKRDDSAILGASETLKQSLLNSWQRRRIYQLSASAHYGSLEETIVPGRSTVSVRSSYRITLNTFVKNFRLVTDLDMLKLRETMIDAAIEIATRKFSTRVGI